jgi:predicted neuraminidase
MIDSNPFKGEKCRVKSEFIYQPWNVGFPSCHVSTLTENKKGLLAAWFEGNAESSTDIGIWISHFINGSCTKPLKDRDW